MILTVIKVIIMFAGMGLALANFIPGIIKKDKLKQRKGILLFLLTWMLLIIIGALDFMLI